MNRTKITEYIITSIAKHPYLIAFIICMFINPFFYCQTHYIPYNTISLIVFSLITIVGFISFHNYKNHKLSFFSFWFILLSEIVVFLNLSLLYCDSQNKGLWLFAGFCSILFILYYYADKTKYRLQITSLLIIGISFALYFYYILGTSIYIREHDVGIFENSNRFTFCKGGGHASYIEYIQKNYKLPDGDVSKVWQFAQPPLHHILCTIWLEINEKAFNLDKNRSHESLQILSLFYVMCIIISAYKIFKYFKLSEIPFFCSLTLTCFFPAFILLSGSINNDALSIAFIVGAMLNALYWKQNPTMDNILNIALCLGLGMMTKISVGSLAPALAVLFVITYIKNRNKKELLKQFLVFLIISIPLGTWFGIRNYIKYNIPFTFVHQMDTIPFFKVQYIGDKPFLDRITDFSLSQFDSVYVRNKQFFDSRNDYNPIITLMKTALFDEFIRERNFIYFPGINKISVVFFIVFFVISIISVLSMLYITFQSFSRKEFVDEYVFMFVFFITLILCVYKHSYNIPYVAAMNFRFITPTVIINHLFFGLVTQYFKNIQKKIRNFISISLSIVFAMCSIIIYLSLI